MEVSRRMDVFDVLDGGGMRILERVPGPRFQKCEC